MSDQIVLALIAGVMTPLQAAVNARLGCLLGPDLGGGSVRRGFDSRHCCDRSLTTHTLPRTTGAANLPWWALTGGLYGAFFLTATTFAVPKLGSATMMAMVVTGQVIFSLLLDRIGLLAGAMLIR